MLIGLYSSSARSGKSTVADFLVDNYDYRPLSLAKPIKAFLCDVMTSYGISDERIFGYLYGDKKHEFVPEMETTAREIMVSMGTAWGRRTVHFDIWLNQWAAAYNPTLNTVVDDVRFLNEFNRIKELGGEMWKIVALSPGRPFRDESSDALLNSSESNLDKVADSCWDEIIINKKSGIPALYWKIQKIVIRRGGEL